MKLSPTHNVRYGEFVVLMALFVAIIALSIDTILPALLVVGNEYAISNINHTQYMVSFLFLGLMLGQILSGPLSDSFGRKPTAYIGFAVFIAGSMLSYVSQSYELMLAGRFLQGLGASSPRIVSVAMVRDKYSGRDMAKVMSIIMAVFIFVPALAPALGEVIMKFLGWRSIFLVLAAVAMGTALWGALRLPETLTPADKRPFTPKSIWVGMVAVVRNKVTLGYTVCAGLAFGNLVGYISSARQIFQDYFATGHMFVVYFAISALTIGGASLVNSMIVKKHGMRKISHVASLAMACASLLFLLVVLAVPYSTPLWAFMLYMPIAFFCLGLLFGNYNALAMEPMGHIAGLASAVIGSFSSAISLAAGTVIGQAYDDTLRPIVLGFLVLSSLTFLLQRRINTLQPESCKPDAR